MDVSCGLFLDVLDQDEEVPLSSCFSDTFHHEWMLNFVKLFFSINCCVVFLCILWALMYNTDWYFSIEVALLCLTKPPWVRCSRGDAGACPALWEPVPRAVTAQAWALPTQALGPGRVCRTGPHARGGQLPGTRLTGVGA